MKLLFFEIIFNFEKIELFTRFLYKKTSFMCIKLKINLIEIQN